MCGYVLALPSNEKEIIVFYFKIIYFVKECRYCNLSVETNIGNSLDRIILFFLFTVLFFVCIDFSSFCLNI